MHAATLLTHQPRQCIQVGALQLRQASPGQDAARQLVVGRQLLEYALCRRVAGLGLLEHRELELLEEDHLQLLGRADQKLLAREFVNLALQPSQLALVLLGERQQPRLVDPHTRPLDVCQHAGQRHLHLVEERRQPVLLEALANPRQQDLHGTHLLARPGGEVSHSQIARRDRLGAAPGQVFPARYTSLCKSGSERRKTLGARGIE